MDKEAMDSFLNHLLKKLISMLTRKRMQIKNFNCKTRVKKGSPYLEFTAVGNFYGTPNVPIIGLIAFTTPVNYKKLKSNNDSFIYLKPFQLHPILPAD